LLLGTTNYNARLTPDQWATYFGFDPGSSLPQELYKSNSGDSSGLGSDEGSYAGSYKTLFSNTPTDPSDALIEYIGGSFFSCATCY
jgi:hypothetical protein